MSNILPSFYLGVAQGVIKNTIFTNCYIFPLLMRDVNLFFSLKKHYVTSYTNKQYETKLHDDVFIPVKMKDLYFSLFFPNITVIMIDKSLFLGNVG